MSVSDKIKAHKEKRSEKKALKKSGAITQKNIEESRDEILAKGKKFKYPFQYAKHRLIFNTIIIGVVAIGVFVLVGWYQLFRAQSTSEVIYRFTKAFGVTVAEVDSVKVRFSDYLMLYRSSVASMERQQGTFDSSEESKLQKEYFKRQALSAAEDYSYAMSKLEEAGKSVTDAEIDEVIEGHKVIDGEKRSNEAFEGIVRENFGLSMKEYRRLIMLSLAKKKANVEFDKDAKALADEIEAALAVDSNFETLAQKYADNDAVSYELVEGVEETNLDSGRASMAASLENIGDVSKYFVSKNGDGYYFVKLTAKSDERVLSYASIWVRFKWLDEEMSKLRRDGKVHENIELKADNAEAEKAKEPDTEKADN